jgi:rSAM/selenodomain-associated transferase 2
MVFFIKPAGYPAGFFYEKNSVLTGCFVITIGISLHMRISVIIPVYNEALLIADLVRWLRQHGGDLVKEIIVCDGGSTDDTVAAATAAGANVLIAPKKGRAVQMNEAAAAATGDVLYFVHADTRPPVHYAQDIAAAVAAGYEMGRYRSRFDTRNWLMKLNAWFTRFDWFVCMGGDQSLFVTAALFSKTGGYDSTMLIMEEYEFCTRAKKQARYKIFADTVLISTRKYEGRSWWQVQRANYRAVQMYKSGAAQQEIAERYREMLRRKTDE